MGTKEIGTVAVVGTGIIGASWACLFLAHGIDVVGTDIRDGAENRLREAINQLGRSLPEAVFQNTNSGRLTFHRDLSQACKAADFVQESAVERKDAKIELMRQIDAAVRPDVVIASSSSAISVTDMQSACSRPERVILGHPFNPVHLMPLVELAGGEKTEECYLAKAERFYSSLGKETIRLKKEVYGHIANRMQAAIFREAIHLLDSGVADVEDIDRAVSEGPGLRWALNGPLLTYRLAGGENGMQGFWDMFAPMQKTLWQDLGSPVPDAALQNRVTAAVEQAYGDHSPIDLASERDAHLQAYLTSALMGQNKEN